MRKLRVLSDRLVGLVAPNVTAKGLWYWEYRCTTTRCSSTAYLYRRRYCHDGSGYCQAWQNVSCTCH
jgi:hypothetical protein